MKQAGINKRALTPFFSFLLFYGLLCAETQTHSKEEKVMSYYSVESANQGLTPKCLMSMSSNQSSLTLLISAKF